MKKTTRKIISAIILTIMLFNSLLAVTPATATTSNGMTFTSGFDNLYATNKALDAKPYTFEATITLPESYFDQWWGNIIAWNSNQNGSDYIFWDIRENVDDKSVTPRKIGTRLLVGTRGASGTTSEVIAYFDGALTSYRGQTVHIALTLDNSNKAVNLYVNGKKYDGTATYSHTGSGVASAEGLLNTYNEIDLAKLPKGAIGGDFRNRDAGSQYAVQHVDNFRWFRGAIHSVCAFTDLRTATEIEADKTTLPTSGDNLLLCYDTSELSNNSIPDKSGNGYILTKNPFANQTTTGGMTFSADTKFVATKKNTAVPRTFEATIRVDSNTVNGAYTGVMIGNYENDDKNGIIMDMAYGGPRIYIRANGKNAGVMFKGTLAPYVNQKVHVAITIDPTNQVTTLYINGVKVRDAKDGNNQDDYEWGTDGSQKANFFSAYNLLSASSLPYQSVGGDLRANNTRWFHGAIYSASVFSSVRSAAQLTQDMNAMPQNDTSLLSWYEAGAFNTAGGLLDKSGNGYDLARHSKWFTNKAPYTDYAYSFAVVGDTQVITVDEAVTSAGTYSPSYKGNLSKIYDYILNNKDTKNIKFSFHMGDVTDVSNAAEWKLAMENIRRMDGKIPYNIVRGNHDNSNDFIREYTMDIFKGSVVDGEEYGTFDGNTLNTYQTITVGDIKYLMISLDFGAGKAMIAWANKVIKDHPYHNVIISTHSYLRPDGSYVDYRGNPNDESDCSASNYRPGRIFGGTAFGGKYNYDARLDKYKNGGDAYLYQDASYLWNNLVKKHENVVMVLCGHEISDYILNVEGVGDHGNKIAQILIDPQGLDRELQKAGQGHAGLVAMLYFSEDGKTVSTEYYSTIRNEYYMPENCYTFELNVIKAPTEGEANKPGTSKPSDGGTSATDVPSNESDVSTETDAAGEETVGCGSTISFSAMALVSVVTLGSALIVKKHD